MTTTNVAPRIYCIPALRAPIVAVFQRGPTGWCRVGRWKIDEQKYESGAWFHGRIFPRRSDLSPDGQFLCYFAHKPGASWEHGEAYVALSKLPWLTSLQAFKMAGTWTRGYFFCDRGKNQLEGADKLPIPFGLASIPVIQFAIERSRGWQESPDSPPKAPNDAWDENRNCRIQKRQPGGRLLLCAERAEGSQVESGRDQAIDGMSIRYWLEGDKDVIPLDEIQWADWHHDGSLLVATRSGKLQILNGDTRAVLFDEDLSNPKPETAPAPTCASEW